MNQPTNERAKRDVRPWYKKLRWWFTIAFAAIIVAFSVIASGGSGAKWGDYSPTLRTRIDALADAKDCAGLQAEFDNEVASNTATARRTGHNNAGVMNYIDDKMTKAGCHG